MYTLNSLTRFAVALKHTLNKSMVAAALLGSLGAAGATSCILSANDVALPTYYWTTPTALIYAPTVATLACTAETPSDVNVSVSLDTPSESGGMHSLTSGLEHLLYRISLPGMQGLQPWGNGQAGSVVFERSLSNMTSTSLNITPTLEVPPGQRVRGGNYGATLNLTMNMLAP
ncbi:hypothetical protein GCM10022631_21670 [Deinococcus rubellus]|uniref:Spore coat protein U domain-containing protein n=1 Tax=Deinococcus rubellus TaxID=1889240 RepID=A0ABY5YGT9_9DEIO|nr:spore coat protein U domain-containing protein [Deinococcus rubellus]UWX64334.1 spore coat protein U domain-containing protein [Deinococcus rubellus]